MRSVTVTVALLLSALLAGGQSVTRTIQFGCPASDPCVTLNDVDGGGYTIYIGRANQKLNSNGVCSGISNPGANCIKRGDSTLTSIAVTSQVATITCQSTCGVAKSWEMTISGATVDADLNGRCTVASTPSPTTYTCAVTNVSNATYTESTLRVDTFFPLTTQKMWTVQAFAWDGSHNFLGSKYVLSCIGSCLAWTDRALY